MSDVRYLAVGHYLQGEGGQVQRVHDEAQLVPRLVQEVLQALVPEALHVRPHHPWEDGKALSVTFQSAGTRLSF